MISNAIHNFLLDWSLEIVPTEGFSGLNSSVAVAPGTSVYVTSIPGQGNARLLQATETLKRAGFEPVPHIAARSVTSIEGLHALLSALETLGVQRLLLLGGDIPRVTGPFASSLEMLESGILERYSFKQLGFATYPEGNPSIPTELLETQLRSKIRVATELGFESWLVTQLCFDTIATVRHIERFRARSIHIPIHVGLAGPTSWKGMIKFAAICGVSRSARSLRSNVSRVRQLVSGFDPSDQIADLATFKASSPFAGKIKPHFFTFGGSEKTANWVTAFARENCLSRETVE